jgi:hypothetical protein
VEISSSLTYKIEFARLPIRTRLLAGILFLATIFYSTFSFAQILGTGQLSTERRGHTATLLQNGKILIVGGENQNGILSQAEIFDPVSLTSTPAPAAVSPRTDHTTTLLPDGRVLISGGRDQVGALDSTEVYDSGLGLFSSGPSMKRPRSGHTATALSDGKILIAGGDASGTAEIYDAATQSFSLVTGSITTPRQFHSAALLKDGRVLIAGGVNTQNTMLKTAEVYDPQLQAFNLPATDMQTARAFATLKLLEDGKVQLIGGDAEFSMEIFDPTTGIFNAKALLPPNANLLGATLSTQSRAALFSPSISQDPLLQSVLTPEQLALLDRADQSITELPQTNQALVAGGVNSAGQVLKSAKLVSSSSATITTDKTDYPPGEIVTITGSGFQPNERVDLSLHEFPEEYPDITFSAVTNQQGSFVAADFAPQLIDLDRTFTLTAIGQSSGFTAQTAFTDGQPESVTLNPTSRTVTPGGTALYDATVVMVGNNDACTINLEVVSGLPAGASASFNNNPVALPNGSGSNDFSRTLTINTMPTTPLGTYSFTVRATRVIGSGCQPNAAAGGTGPTTIGTLVVGTAPTITSVNSATFTIGAAGSFTITTTGSPTPALTRSGALPSGVTFIDNGNGTATLSGTPALGTVGSYGITITANNGVSPNATQSFNLTVEKADQTITFGAVTNKTYGDPDFNVSATASSGLAVSFSSLTTAKCTVSGNSVHIVEAGLCTIRASQSGNSDYQAAPDVDQSFTINKATSTITWNDPADINYGTALSATQLNATANVPGTFTYNPSAGTVLNAGNNQMLHVDFTPTDATNYNNASTDVKINVLKATLTVKADDKEKFYDGAGFTGFTSSFSGFVNGDTASVVSGTVTYTGAATTAVNVGSYTITPLVSGLSATNYSFTAADGILTIKKATPTVSITGGPFTYDGNPHGATCTVTGIGGLPIAGTCDLTYTPGGITAPTSAGTYSVSASFTSSDSNYDNATGSGSITINKATPTVSVTGGPFTYDGSPHAATVTVTGVGGVSVPGTTTLNYAGVPPTSYGPSTTAPTNAGTYAARAVFTSSDPNYENALGSAQITINKAATTTTVTVADATYDANPHGATASVTGPGGLSEALTVTYAGVNGTVYGPSTTAPINAGSYAASATYAETANYLGSSDSKTFNINKANATINVVGYTGVYDGNAHGASGTATGVGGVDLSASLNFGSTFTNVPGGTAHWTFTGGTNYNDASGDVAIVINKANPTCSVTPYSVTYDGNAHTASGSCSGVNGEGLSGLDLSGTTHTNAGIYTDTWTFTDSTGNYNNASSTVTDEIKKADPVVVATGKTCTYNGSPCTGSGSATGVNGENLTPVTLAYRDALNNLLPSAPLNAGTYQLAARFAGNANYNQKQSSPAMITINKATPTVSVTGGPFTYDGSSHAATVTATGVGGVAVPGSFSVIYMPPGNSTVPVNAGTYSVSASFTSADSNYNNATGIGSITINKADTSTAVLSSINPSIVGQTVTFEATVSVLAPGAGTPTGYVEFFDGTTSLGTAALSTTVPFKASISTSVLSVGSHSVTAKYLGDGNFKYSTSSILLQTVNYNFLGFLSPVQNPSALNAGKAGRTYPIKWQLTNYSGGYFSDLATVSGLGYYKVECNNSYAYGGETLTESATGGTVLRYDTTDNQFIYNWQTPKSPTPGCYVFVVRLIDGSVHQANFSLQK